MKNEFITKTKVTFNEYKKLRKLFPSPYFKKIVIASIIIFAIGGVSLIPPDPLPILDVLLVNFVLIAFFSLILIIFELIFKKYNYKKYLKKNPNDIDYILKFYDDYLEKESENEVIKIKYNNITKIKETRENIYIFLADKKKIIIIKDKCTKEIVELVRNISSENVIIKYQKKYKEFTTLDENKYKTVRIILIILFILSILSLWAGLFFSQFVSRLNNVPHVLWTQNMWVLYLCLPIPILSIVLGFIYVNKGVKCIKNIVCGFIIGFLLLIFGSFSSKFDYRCNYEEIYSYKNIIGVNQIPTQGEYDKIVWDSSYLQNHISHYIKFTDNEELKLFYNNISINSNWLVKEKLGTNISSLIPTSMLCEKYHKCYYSLYIKELDEYNKYPTETGNYNIYAMLFDYNSSYLQIEEYSYDYKE